MRGSSFLSLYSFYHRVDPSSARPGFYKVYFDATTFVDLGCIGIGVVIRDRCGNFFAALSQKVVGLFDASIAEAEGLPLNLLRIWAFGEFTWKGDARFVMAALKKAVQFFFDGWKLRELKTSLIFVVHMFSLGPVAIVVRRRIV